MQPEPPDLSKGRGLLLVCAYRSNVSGARSVKPGSFGAHRALYRDYYANPRSPAVQREIIERALCDWLKRLDIRVDDAVAAAWPERAAQQLRAFTASEASAFDTVVIAYPDPLGLTWGGLEDRLIAAGKAVAVVNGRGRFFTLTPDLRAAMGFRRFLAETRLPEMAMGAISLPTAAVLSAYDAVRGRS